MERTKATVERRRPVPLTALGSIVLLAVQLARAAVPDPPPPELREIVERCAPAEALAAMGVRELRRLPGVGEVLALEIVRHRRAAADGEHGADAVALEEVRGIGPITARRAREWLARHGIADGR